MLHTTKFKQAFQYSYKDPNRKSLKKKKNPNQKTSYNKKEGGDF